MNKMVKSKKNKAKHDKNNAYTVSYGLRNKPGGETVKNNIKDVNKMKHETGINIVTPNTKPSVLSTKVRRGTKQLTVDSTPKARPTRSKKTNESLAKVNKANKNTVKTKKCSVVLTQLAMKTNATKISKSPIKNISRIVELGKRLEKLNADKKQRNKIVANKLLNNKVNSTDKTTATQNKTLSTPLNKSTKSTRVLRKRNIIPNKYKDYSLNSPLITKVEKPKSPNPMAVYEFEFDSAEEPTEKKKNEDESSDDENNSMKIVLKKLQQRHKKTVKNKKTKTVLKSKQAAEKQRVEEQHHRIVEQEKNHKTNESDISHACAEENRETKANQTEEKQNKAAEQNIPLISMNSVQMISLSDESSPVIPVDPSIQARNIVDEVTKSFIEDLSDEEINSESTGKINIISNVTKNSKLNKRKRKFFNSTTIGFKPSQPWRINVSAIKKRPQFFSYKDKSFTPRYDREVITINDSTISKKNNTNISKINVNKTDTLHNNIQNHQTSILDFIKNSKPKIPENKIELFKDLTTKSPRKVLGAINFVQSTPLKPILNLNNLKSPNISIISPKRKKDSMFGFSYLSDDENKENRPKSPRKIKFKSPNTFEKIAENPVQKISTKYVKNNEIFMNNLTDSNREKSISPIDTQITEGLFQDNQLEVSKKSTRTYVRKHPKRKRLPSLDSNHSDAESEPEKPERKKQKNTRTKEEEKEADRLASHYNSMFEEIENYPLLIE